MFGKLLYARITWLIENILKTANMNTKLSIISIAIISVLSLGSCNKTSTTTNLVGNWVHLSDFDGSPRSDAVAFDLNGKGYIGTGYDGDARLNDFWEYNADKDYWVQKASLPGAARSGAVGFATDTKGYIGTGYDGLNKLNDFWEYDPVANTWTQKASFGGTPRYGAVGFALNNHGYLGTGYDGSTLKDFWRYSPDSDAWTQVTSVGGSKRRDAVAFVINGKGYIATGINNGVYVTDFWEYTPETDTWTRKRDIANTSADTYDDAYAIIRASGVGFSVNGKGYVGTGGLSSVSNDIWEYNPLTDLWIQKTSLEGAQRTEAVAFSIGNRGYVLTGRNSSYYFDDNWGFDPNAEYNKYD